jgi:hypothetical protein
MGVQEDAATVWYGTVWCQHAVHFLRKTLYRCVDDDAVQIIRTDDLWELFQREGDPVTLLAVLQGEIPLEQGVMECVQCFRWRTVKVLEGALHLALMARSAEELAAFAGACAQAQTLAEAAMTVRKYRKHK